MNSLQKRVKGHCTEKEAKKSQYLDQQRAEFAIIYIFLFAEGSQLVHLFTLEHLYSQL